MLYAGTLSPSHPACTTCVQLATALLPVCDPLLQAPSESVDEGAEALIPAFAQPKIQQGILPGGLHYVHAEKPNRGESLDKLMAREDHVRVLMLRRLCCCFLGHFNGEKWGALTQAAGSCSKREQPCAFSLLLVPVASSCTGRHTLCMYVHM